MANCAILLILVGCSAASPAQVEQVSTYECSGGKTFTVRRDPTVATVDYGEQSFQLSRRSSSLGMRYSSKGASLIIDGDFAVFATDKILNLKLCKERLT